jgi:nitroimidazol reductase NimA-like FMN-containing flavoprotein (pyridoxamine 5'-phosphate oxidase superfamily)
MADTKRTVFRDLDAGECRWMLRSHNVGRLAFTFNDRVDIEPINYVVIDDDTLAFRTVEGSKVDVLRHHPWVAFEIDEVKELLDWRSVVVHGTIYHVTRDAGEHDRAMFARVVDRLRELVPPGNPDADPLADRPIALCLHIDRLTGREAKTVVA